MDIKRVTLPIAKIWFFFSLIGFGTGIILETLSFSPYSHTTAYSKGQIQYRDFDSCLYLSHLYTWTWSGNKRVFFWCNLGPRGFRASSLCWPHLIPFITSSSNPRCQSIQQSYSNKNNMYQHRNGHIDQSNRIVSREINPCLGGQFIYDKGGTDIMGKRQSLQQMVLGKLTTTCKRMKLHYF